MTEQNNDKSCKNCRYYSQHFSKQGTTYDTVCCGHCLHKNAKNYKRRPLELCEYWEDIKMTGIYPRASPGPSPTATSRGKPRGMYLLVGIKKTERKKSIVEMIEFMTKRLDEMLMILKDDENQES